MNSKNEMKWISTDISETLYRVNLDVKKISNKYENPELIKE